jgi:hypothetical protein
MCEFFSFVTDPDLHGGKRFYFNKEQRKYMTWDSADSHSIICKHYNLHEDGCNKYEYNPFRKVFNVDRIGNPVDDTLQAEDWVKKLDFEKKIYPDKFELEKFGWKVGDVLVFRDLDYLRTQSDEGKIPFQWANDNAMDFLVNDKVEIELTYEHMFYYGNKRQIKIYLPDEQWMISAEMLMKKE